MVVGRERRAGGRSALLDLPLITSAVAVVAVVLHLLPGVPEGLQLDWHAVDRGEHWRLVTSQLVHWSGDHLFWDVATFAVVGAFCERTSRSRFVACLFGALLAIPVLVHAAAPHIQYFRGLSGVDCALFALAGVGLARLSEPATKRVGVGFMVALLAKVIYEVRTGDVLFVAPVGFVPVPLAHAAGILIGAVAAVSDWPPVGAYRERASVLEGS